MTEEPGNSNEDNWADQLRDAAYNDPSAPTTISVGENLGDDSVSQANTCGERGITVQGGNGKDATSHLLVSEPTIAPEYARQPDTSTAAERTAPKSPKKVLKVRPDGRLASPKASSSSKAMEAAQGAKPKRMRRTAGSIEMPKVLIVTVMYGDNDKSRAAVGTKVDNILSGKVIEASFTNDHAAVSSGLPRATHPFFLGGTARTSGRRTSVSSERLKEREPNADLRPVGRKEVSPRKSRVTSKPVDTTSSPTENTWPARTAFGSDHARVSRFPGAIEPMWPPRELLHVDRGASSLEIDLGRLQAFRSPSADRKLKGVEVKVAAEEEVLRQCLNVVRSYENDRMTSQRVTSRDWREFRRPLRRLMSGPTLQKAVRRELASKLQDLSPDTVKDQSSDELSVSNTSTAPTHKALKSVFNAIATSRTAFDKFECEAQDWVHKYAPKSAEEVLQSGREVKLLRNWLKSLTTNAVDHRTSGARESSALRKLGAKTAKRKRKRADELDDFIVSSDEEANEMDEVIDPNDNPSTNPRSKPSVIRTGDIAGASGSSDRLTNTIVISGPHGCGKTAAVYAIAQELGFEVFEINPGSRRSGKDILDKVGDMTRNHLVGHASAETPAISTDENEEMNLVVDNLKKDIETGRQGTMNDFFRAKGTVKSVPPKSAAKASKASPKRKEAPNMRKSQKQSLILLEEVDVLFDEDKMFWTTTLSLVLQSKRPVIMTCTDERLLPLKDMSLYAVLRFKPTPPQLATDYLVLVACNEGHLLPRNAVSALYAAKRSDMRASISELNFFCQMAIGDTKGGLDWMLTRAVAEDPKHKNSNPIRVVSERSYEKGMGWLSGEAPLVDVELSLNQEVELLLEVWNGWGMDIGASEGYLATHAPATVKGTSEGTVLEALQDYDTVAEALSAGDTLPACVSRDPGMMLLETALPEVTDKMRSNYTEDAGVLLADPLVDYSGVTESLVLMLRACARRLLQQPRHCKETRPFNEQSIACMISGIMQECPTRQGTEKVNKFAGFEPIARSANAVLGAPKGPQISSFDGSTSVIAEDLAPYVRNIVSYDLRLEDQRRQLSSLHSGPGKGGKKARTTRSSRAALEGGQKALTRRERWFPDGISFDLVLQSGGAGWQEALQRVIMGTSSEPTGSGSAGSRRSSLGSAIESDL